MSGIMGYAGTENAVPILLEGLRKLESRGCDSVGLAVVARGRIQAVKTVGSVAALVRLLPQGLSGQSGIGHTRWASHGAVTADNAHPHTDPTGSVAVVHNGVIDNYEMLRGRMEAEGSVFRSDTDSEVLAHLVAKYLKGGDLMTAVKRALAHVEGTFGLVVLSREHPEHLVAARNGSPVILGVGAREHFVSSDPGALLPYTEQLIYLQDGEISLVGAGGLQTGRLSDSLAGVTRTGEWNLKAIERGEYPHFMLKEIYEQPHSVERAFAGRTLPEYGTTKFGGLNVGTEDLLRVQRMVLIGSGSSYNAAVYGSYVLSDLARIPTMSETGPEMLYKNPLTGPDSLYLALSQSGETRDTLDAVREVRRRGGTVLGICSAVGSTIARECTGGAYTHSGPEVAVSTTKSFTAQMVTLFLVSVHMGRIRHLPPAEGKRLLEDLVALPKKIQGVLDRAEAIRMIALKYARFRSFLVVGSGYSYPVALEGAMKLKDVSYVHAEGLAACEVGHGPVAVVGPSTAVVMVAPRDSAHERTVAVFEQLRKRRAPILVIATENDSYRWEGAEDLIRIPGTSEPLSPVVSVVPLQLLAYHLAVALGLPVDNRDAASAIQAGRDKSAEIR